MESRCMDIVRRVALLTLALLLFPGAATLSAGSIHSLARQALVSDDGLPWVSLEAGQSIAPSDAPALSTDARPTAIASVDLNGDTAEDLIAGYAIEGAGMLAVYLGVPGEGMQSHPAEFAPDVRTYPLPAAPDMLGAGDFDADGDQDVLAATVGGATFWLLPGDGAGGLGEPQPGDLPGGATALAVGELNRQDGLADLAIAVDGPDGAQALVFEGERGAWFATPEAYDLPAPGMALAIGQLDDAYPYDLAIAAGASLVLVFGRDRTPEDAPPAVVTTYPLEGEALALAVGDWIGGDDEAAEVAWLGSDGEIRVVEPGDSGAGAALRLATGAALSAEPGARPMLLRAKTSSLPTDDLLLVDGAGGPVRLLTADGRRLTEAGLVEAVSPGLLATLGSGGASAALPVRLNGDALCDLVTLVEGQPAPIVALSDPVRTFVVDSYRDDPDEDPGDGACNTSEGGCTLRAAIEEANASAGADLITFYFFSSGGKGRPTIVPATSLPAITEAVTVEGFGYDNSPFPETEIDASQMPWGIGLEVTGGASTIRNLNIYGAPGLGLKLGTNGGNLIEHVRAGTDYARNAGLGNGGDGIVAGSNDNDFYYTTVAGNVGYGYTLSGNGNRIRYGNYVGMTSADARLANGRDGVSVYGDNNEIGVNSLTHNWVSGNGQHGIHVNSSASGTMIQNVYIGVNTAGETAVGNTQYGVLVDSAPATTVGPTSTTAKNVIGGNAVGVMVSGAGATDAIVRYNYIGVNAAGSGIVPQIGNGIYLYSEADGTTVSGNAIGGNGAYGVYVTGSRTSGGAICVRHAFTGNYLGTTANASIPDYGNERAGIYMQDSGCNTVSGNLFAHNETGLDLRMTGAYTTTIGSNTFVANGAGARIDTDGNRLVSNVFRNNATGLVVNGDSNVLLSINALGNPAGEQLVGIEINGDGNTLRGEGTGTGLNYIKDHAVAGVQLNGNANVVRNYGVSGNWGPGIEVSGDDNTIGGTGSNARIYAGGNNPGILLRTGASGNRILGSWIGVPDAALVVYEGNSTGGIVVNGDHNVIGGDAAGEGNLIGRALLAPGVLIEGAAATANQVLSNTIGVESEGDCQANEGHGIAIAANGTTVRGNAIACNYDAGIRVTSGTGNRILDNRLTGNSDLGIDLGAAGVTHNDTGDGDGGANALQNYPVISSVTSGSDVRIQGALSSAASTGYTLQFFLNDDCDDSGYGQGQTYLGQTTVSTDGDGRAGFDVTFAVAGTLGKYVSATATDPDGNTSEFSKCSLGRPASSGTAFVVNAANDAGDINTEIDTCDSSTAAGEQCTLRAAVQQANHNTGADTIIVPAGTYVLTLAGLDADATAGDLDITDITGDLTIIGAGADVTTIQSTVADRVFDVIGGTRVTMTGLTVTGGAATTSAPGGGIRVDNASAHLTLESVSVEDNQTASGSGGGIYSSGSITLTNSAVISNTTTTGGDGGGLAFFSGSADLKNSTVSGNATNGNGGGIYNLAATVHLNNVTVTNNTADANDTGGDTVGGGGLANAGATFTLANTIVAGNVDGSVVLGSYPNGHADCKGSYASEGYNLIGDAARKSGEEPSCQVTGGAGDSIGGIPMPFGGEYLVWYAGLGPLRLNGGSTPNHMPVSSGAGLTVDWGNPATPDGSGGACEPFDQRGQPRPIDGGTDGVAECDRGAVEHVPAYLSIDDVIVAEGSGAIFTASLSEPAQITFTVQYSTTDGSAVAGHDYATTSGTLTFAPGQEERTFTVNVLNDTLNEADETFRVGLHTPQYVRIADGEGLGTITDGDAQPAILVNDATGIEGAPGSGGQVTFAVTLNSASGKTVTVDYALQAGTATADADYVAAEGTLFFAPGETSREVAVGLIGDDLKEGNETFTLVLSDPVNASLGDATGAGTIVDDDVPAFAVGDASRLEGHSGSGAMLFTVRLLKPSNGQTSVAYSTSPGTATAGADYVHASGVLTFAAGETLKTAAVTINGDDVIEEDETLTLTLSAPTGGATIAVGSATGTILDDDGAENESKLYLPLVVRR